MAEKLVMFWQIVCRHALETVQEVDAARPRRDIQ